MTKLLERRPKIAHLKQVGAILDIQAAELVPSSTLFVKQGELFPVDGTVISGRQRPMNLRSQGKHASSENLLVIGFFQAL